MTLEFAGASKDDVIEALIQLRVAVHPFHVVLGRLNDDCFSTVATSGLFPEVFDYEDADFVVHEGGDFIPKQIKPENLHDTPYVEKESFVIDKGSVIHDLFSVFEINQSFSVAEMYGGNICMGDVRHLNQVFKPKK